MINDATTKLRISPQAFGNLGIRDDNTALVINSNVFRTQTSEPLICHISPTKR